MTIDRAQLQGTSHDQTFEERNFGDPFSDSQMAPILHQSCYLSSEAASWQKMDDINQH